MGLKVNQQNSLEDLFNKFAIEPPKKSKDEEKESRDPKKEDKTKKK